MGSVCCCFHVPDIEENVESNHENCMCPGCFIQALKNKRAATSRPMVAPESRQFDARRPLPNNVNSQNSHLELEPPGRTNPQICPEFNSDEQNGSYRGEKSKECHSESSGMILLEKVESGVGHVSSTSEDMDVCPTCLEEYTLENPKIIIQCRHHYHLSCIYEWMERSEKCPVCGRVIQWMETTTQVHLIEKKQRRNKSVYKNNSHDKEQDRGFFGSL